MAGLSSPMTPCPILSHQCHLPSHLPARLTGPEWADQLPRVLLSLRTTPKEDLKSTVAELVYGSTIVLPGDFILPAEADGADAGFLRHLRGDIARLRPTPTSRHGNKPSYIPTPLRTAEFVFIRHDATRRPLQRPYNGPFRVVRRNEKDLSSISAIAEKILFQLINLSLVLSIRKTRLRSQFLHAEVGHRLNLLLPLPRRPLHQRRRRSLRLPLALFFRTFFDRRRYYRKKK